MGLNGKSGFTAMEVMITLIVISIITAVVMKPVTGVLQRLKLQNSADGIKHMILNARMRAVSNAQRHCGVVFRVHTASSINDTIFAFLEKNPPDNLYTKGVDSLYGKPFVLEKKYKINSAIPPGYPSVVVFRGDGSANVSAKLALSLNSFMDTVDILASTGRVKVKTQ